MVLHLNILPQRGGAVANAYGAYFATPSGATNNNIALIVGSAPGGTNNLALYTSGASVFNGTMRVAGLLSPEANIYLSTFYFVYNGTLQIKNKAGSNYVTFATRDTSGSEAVVNFSNVGTIASGLINGQTISSASNFTGTMAITGNVGIGTAAPVYKLSVNNLFGVNSSGYALLPLGAVGTPSLSFTSDTNTGLWSSGADTLNFSTAGSEWMRIASDGNVGIGTTNPGAQLDLSTDSARKLTSNTWSTGSDSRIKTNIESIENALEIIREVRPVKYHYTAEFLALHPSVKDTDYYNFIAQEYQEIFPESVNEVDGLLFLNSSNMIPYAIAGIKEIDSRLTELELLLGSLNANGTIGDGSTADGAVSGEENSLSMASIIKNTLSSLGLTIENGILSIKELITDKITTKELCIDDVCINRSQLKELLDKNLIQSSTDDTTSPLDPSIDDPTEDINGDTADTISPIITLLGDFTVNLVVGDSYVDAGASASDDTDGDITTGIIIVNPVDTNVEGTYTITYNISDTAGNKATEVTRTVIVSVPESDTNSSTPTGEDTTDVQTPDASAGSEG